MMLEQLRPMAVFATVAEIGSFSGAARRLGLSASVVSYHVSTLEAHLDTPLVYRTTRRLSLTAAGQQLAGAARAMLTEAEVGLAELGTQGVNASGTLKITAPAILQFSRFVTRTATFIRHHPNVEISMGFSDRDRDIIAEGYDIGFRLGPLANSTLISRQLVEGKMVLCASPDFVKSNAPIRGPDDIFNIDAIATVGQALRLVLNPRSETKRRTEVALVSRIVVDSGFAARRLAEEGVGLVILPDFFVREALDNGELVEVLEDWDAPQYTIHALWPPNVGSNHLRAAYLNFVAAIARTSAETDRTMT